LLTCTFLFCSPGTLLLQTTAASAKKKGVASRHLKGSRRLQNFDFSGGFVSGIGTSSGTTTSSGDASLLGLGGEGSSTGMGNFNTTSGAVGFVFSGFGDVVGSATTGAAGSQLGNSLVMDDVGTSLFAGTTTVGSEGIFGAGLSPPIAGQVLGPTGGFGTGTGLFDISSLSSGTTGGTGAGLSSGDSVGTASNFAGASGSGIIPNFFSAGGTGSGASDGTASGTGSTATDPTGASFMGLGTLVGVDFQNFGVGVFGQGGTIPFPPSLP
jgi:hypothetical protein